MAGQGVTSVRVEGLRELRRRINRVDTGLRDDLKGAHREVANTVLSSAQGAAPHRTGRLMASGRASGTLRASIVRYGGARTPYAGPIHYGWPAHNIAPHPWLLDAARHTEPIWTPVFEQAIADIVERTS